MPYNTIAEYLFPFVIVWYIFLTRIIFKRYYERPTHIFKRMVRTMEPEPHFFYRRKSYLCTYYWWNCLRSRIWKLRWISFSWDSGWYGINRNRVIQPSVCFDSSLIIISPQFFIAIADYSRIVRKRGYRICQKAKARV